MFNEDFFKYVVPDVVSFVIATMLGCIALLPAPLPAHKKARNSRFFLIGVLIVVAVVACIASIRSKYSSEEQAKSDRQQAGKDRQHATEYEQALQTQIEKLNLQIEEDIRTKEAHPIRLTGYGVKGSPEVGQPLVMQLNFELTGSKDATFSEKLGWNVLFIDGDITTYPNFKRWQEETKIWAQMSAVPAPPRTITHGETGLVTVPLMTAPLTTEQVQQVYSGHALIYFMDELTDPKTEKVVFSICKFVDARGNDFQISGCVEHDLTDPVK